MLKIFITACMLMSGSLVYSQTAVHTINVPVDSADFFLQKGLTEKQNGRRMESLKNFEKAVRYDSSSKSIITELASAYHDLRKYNNALVMYKRLIEMGEETPALYKQVLQLCFQMKQNEEVVKKEAQIKELENKIIALQNDKINVEAEIKKRVDENDRIHNKNYKVFNEKIATFELAKQEMLAKLDKQLNEYKAASEENHKKMQYHTTELTRANSELKNKYEAKEKELNEHKNLLTTLKIEQQKVTESAEAKLKELIPSKSSKVILYCANTLYPSRRISLNYSCLPQILTLGYKNTFILDEVWHRDMNAGHSFTEGPYWVKGDNSLK